MERKYQMILFVDDEPTTLQMYLTELSERSFVVKVVSSATELEIYLSKNEPSPKCIVLDRSRYNVPKSN
jgi:DNA-binding response OmpR family regulator